MTPLRSRFTMATVALFLVASSLTGCSSAPQALQQPTAKTLQSGVLGVSTAAAAGKYVVARAALTTVQADLRTAAAAGQVTPARANRTVGHRPGRRRPCRLDRRQHPETETETDPDPDPDRVPQW